MLCLNLGDFVAINGAGQRVLFLSIPDPDKIANKIGIFLPKVVALANQILALVWHSEGNNKEAVEKKKIECL
jgi:hypothetical protein